MAIVYAPPDALDAETFARAGAQEPQFRNAQLALQNQGQILQAQSDFRRSAIAAGEQQARAGGHQAELESRRFEFLSEQAQRDRLAAQEQQSRLQEIGLRGQVQAFLQTMDPGYQEEQQYQRDLNAISAINSDQTMEQFEKDGLIAGKMPGMKFTQQRLMQARAKDEQEQAKRQKALADRETELMDSRARFAAKSLRERTSVLPDGSMMVEAQDGKSIHIPAPKPAPPPKMMSMADMQKEAESHAPDDVFDAEKGTMRPSPEILKERNRYFQEILGRERRKSAGGGAEVNMPDEQQVQQPPPQLSDFKPFRKGEAPPTPQQATQVADIGLFQAHIDRLSSQQKAQMQPILDMLEGIVHGGVKKDERETYDRLISTLIRMPSPGPRDSGGKPEFRKLGDLTYRVPGS